MDRRSFIGSLAAVGCLGAIQEAEASTLVKFANAAGKKTGRKGFDDDLVVFISDLHCNPDGYQPDKLRKVVADILKMRPLPRNVISLGDNAYLTGQPREYEGLKSIIAPIEEAGINLILAMGNHDRRDEFRQAFPGLASKSLMNDRYVFVVKTPKADIIVLDSLQQGEDNTTWITPGKLNDEQKEWLKNTLASYTKPVFVSSHHPISETQISSILVGSPTCCGYIHGHDHRWRLDWFKESYGSTRMIRTLCLPSTGHWGDIGYTCFRLYDDHATATLHESEFFFPEPAKTPAEAPAQWKMIKDDQDGNTCTFSYKI